MQQSVRCCMRDNVKVAVGQFIALFVVLALALFISAGTIYWLEGWLFLVLFFCFYVGLNVWLYRHNPGLLQERMRFRAENQQGWDKILFPIVSLAPLALLIGMSLDAVRFNLSSVPSGIQAAGVVILLASFYLLFVTFRENSYLSTVVRIQQDR